MLGLDLRETVVICSVGLANGGGIGADDHLVGLQLERLLGADFNFMSVPASFDFKTTQIYDPKYQAALYEEGIREGRRNIWLKSPPGQAPVGVRYQSNAPAKARIPELGAVPSLAKPQASNASANKVAASSGWQSSVQSAP